MDSTGVPDSVPVAGSKFSQAGLPLTAKLSGSLSGSLAVGVKWYRLPTVTWAGADPLIAGARFNKPLTVIEKTASVAPAAPSDTLIWMPL